MKKHLKKIIAGIAFLSLITPLFAFAAPFDLEANYRDKFDASDVPLNLTPVTYDDGVYEIPAFLGGGTDGVHPLGSYHYLMAGSGVRITSGNIYSTIDTIETSDGFLRQTLDGKVSTSTFNTLAATVAGLTGGSSFNVSAFMANTASTTPLVATSTFNGFMSNTDKIKLDSLVAPIARAFATTTHAFTTSTGATGFQISSTRDSLVNYSVKVTTTATIGTPSEGYVVLEISPTNSSSASSWFSVGTICGNGQNVSLAALLSSVQTTYCSFNTIVPAGYYVKLRSVTVSDTPTFVYISGYEILE